MIAETEDIDLKKNPEGVESGYMKLAIYGAGGSGKEVYEIVEDCEGERKKWEEIIFIDDTKEEGLFRNNRRIPFSVFVDKYSAFDTQVIIAIGEPKQRKILYDKVINAGFELANVIHEAAKISESANLGKGVVIQDGVIISSDAYIEDNVYLNHRALIGHDVKVGKHCQISCNTAFAGGSELGECVFVGISACVRDHITIGEHSVLSMGTIVMHDVKPYKIVMGNPGREIANNTDEKVF